MTALDEVAYARSLGADVIITDHHVPHSDQPDAAGIINPHLAGGTYPFFQLCGAGLAFKLAQGLYQFHGQAWDRSLLELAALGTIADLVPIVDENRYLVQQGLAALAETRRPGLQALLRIAGVHSGPLTAETVSFQVSPRLNSPGRLGHSMDSFHLLTTDSPAEGQALAEKLESLNRKRRDLTQAAMDAAARQVTPQAEADQLPPVLMVSAPEITRGLAGLVAGRLAETYQRPAVAMAVEDDVIVGSGRSIPEFDIFQAFSDCEDLFVRFGGHSQAAGFTLPRDDLPLLEEYPMLAAVVEDVEFPSADGTVLSGWFIPGTSPRTVILLHGFGEDRHQMLPHAEFLHDAGYSTLLFDQRSRGKSEGEDTSFGYHERGDVEGAVRYLQQRPDADGDNMGVLGVSMGGATAIIAAADMPEIKAVVSESAFSSVDSAVASSFEHFINLPAFPFAPVTVFIMEQRLGISSDDVVPADYVASISPRAVFIIHGQDDVTIVPEDGIALHAEANEPKEPLWLIDGAAHAEGVDVTPDEYARRVLDFLSRHLPH